MEGVDFQARENAGVKIGLPPPPPALFWRPNEPVVNGGVNEAAEWVFFQCTHWGRGAAGDGPTSVERPRNHQERFD